MVLRSVSTSTTSSITSAAPAASTTSAPVVAVSAVNTTLAKGLHVLALLLAAPLATTRLLATILGSLSGLARDVVEERPRLVVGNGNIIARCGLGALDGGSFGGLGQRRASNGLLDNVLLVELGIGLSKVKIRIRHLDLAGGRSSTTTTSATDRSTSRNSINPHLINLLGQIVHSISAAVAQLSHGNCHCGSSGIGRVLHVTRCGSHRSLISTVSSDARKREGLGSRSSQGDNRSDPVVLGSGGGSKLSILGLGCLSIGG